MHFQFHSPYLLFLLLLVPLILFIKGRRGGSATLTFSSTAIAKSVASENRSKIGSFFLTLRILSLTAFILALGRPQLSTGYAETQASGIDIMLAVDISSSMLALDFSSKNKIVTRIDVAKSVIEDFIEQRKNDRIGLIAFAGNPYLVSPLTLNHHWVEQNLQKLHPGIIEDSTAIGSAIGMSVNRMRKLKAKSRVIILLTDGVNNAGLLNPITAAETASSFNIKIYTVAIGKDGIVQAYTLDENNQIVRNIFGQPYILEAPFPIDIDTLEEISKITDAKTYRAINLKELENIYKEIDQLEKTEIQVRQYADYQELFKWALLLGLFFLDSVVKLILPIR